MNGSFLLSFFLTFEDLTDSEHLKSFFKISVNDSTKQKGQSELCRDKNKMLKWGKF